MLPRSDRYIAALLGATILLLTSVEPAQSQDPQASREPAIYTAQLREAIALGRKTLRAIEALPRDDSIPLDRQFLAEARQTYVMVRAARHGMNLRREYLKYPDPMLELAFKRVDQAWDLARVPIDYRTLPRDQYIPRASGDLTQALRLLNQALVILP